MDIEERGVRDFLQLAQNRGGGWEMAMRMMANRILVLEDRLLRAGVSFPDTPTLALRERPTPQDKETGR